MAAVAASIREFGFRQPIVVDAEGVIIVGDTRYLAARQLGLEQVPVHVATDLSAAQLKAYRIADNKTGELADWDHDRLVAELAELEQQAFNLEPLGFSADELQALTGVSANAGLTDPDDVPEPPAAAVTQPGDLWLLGEHLLLCGNASSAADVDRLLAGTPVHLVNTDPPYGVKVEPRSNNAIAAGLSSFAPATHHQQLDLARHPNKARPTTKQLRAKDRPLANDFVSDEEFRRLLAAWFGNLARVLLPGRAFYCWGGFSNIANYPQALAAAGLYFSQRIIWDKEHPVLTRKDFMGAHKWCFYGWRAQVGATSRKDHHVRLGAPPDEHRLLTERAGPCLAVVRDRTLVDCTDEKVIQPPYGSPNRASSRLEGGCERHQQGWNGEDAGDEQRAASSRRQAIPERIVAS